MATDTDGKLKLIVNASLSGTTITYDIEVWSVSWGWNDGQTLVLTNTISASYNYTASSPNGSSVLMYSRTNTKSGSRGNTYTLTVRIDGAYNGDQPQVTVSTTIPIIAPTAPGTPSATSITTSGVTSAWSDPSDWGGNNTSDFHLQIATNSSFTGATTHTVYNANSKTLTGLSPNTTYYLRVRAFNSAGNGSWSSTRTFTTLTAAPTTPGTPSISSLTGTSCTASWTDPSNWGGDDTNDFEYQVSTNSGFTAIVKSGAPSSSPLSITGLTKGTTYDMRVRAYNGGGNSPWSGTRTFTTLSDPGVPTSLAASNLTSVSARIAWAAPASNGGSSITGYDVDVATDAGFSNIVASSSNLGTTLLDLTGLEPATTYYWRVRAKTAIGNSAYATSQFLTISTGYVQTGASTIKPVLASWVQTAPGVTKKVVKVFVKTGPTTWSS